MKRSLSFLSLLLILSFASDAQDLSVPDEKLKRFELGFHFTLLERRDANTALEAYRQNGLLDPDFRSPAIHEAGLGTRLTFNFNKYIAVEAEVNVFPQDKRANPVIGVPIAVIEPGGRKLQGLFGPKIGIRREKFGVFGKVRPGFIGMDRYDVIVLLSDLEGLALLSAPRTGQYFFNVDVGGVFEYYPTKKTILRFDLGDTIIRYNAREPREINPSFTKHNLQIQAGFGFRF